MPVTASYIICAVIAAPALILLGVQDFAAHMFIFYYAVLSEVSPPTALSPFAAAAITGGDPYKTTLQAWKYTLPAFLVPFMFVLDPAGLGLLLMGSFKNLAGCFGGGHPDRVLDRDVRHRGAGRRHAGLDVQEDDGPGAGAPHRRRAVSRLSARGVRLYWACAPHRSDRDAESAPSQTPRCPWIVFMPRFQ